MQVVLSLVHSQGKDRVALKSGWRPGIAEDCKSVSGANWNATKKAWTYPLSMHTLRRLREVFGDELVVAPALNAWARAEVAKEKELSALAKVYDADLQKLPAISPTLATAMGTRTYQRVACRFAATAGSWLLADEPGLGKTATAIGAIMESGEFFSEHLVIAPKSSLDSIWGAQLRRWADVEAYVMPEGADARLEVWERFKADKASPKFLVINPAMIRRLYGHFCTVCEGWAEDDESKKVDYRFPIEHHMQDHKSKNKIKRIVRKESWGEIINYSWNTVILDESHDLLAAYTPSNVSQQTQGLIDLHRRHTYALTGTPLRGQERRIWGTLNLLDPNAWGGYWNFVGEFFEIDEHRYGKTVLGVREDRREALERTLDRVMLRRTRAEVRGDLPLGQRIEILFPLQGRHEKQYREFEKMGEAALVEGTVSGNGVLAELTRLKQLSYGAWTRPNPSGRIHPTKESPLFEGLVQFLHDRGVTGKPKDDWLPEPGVAYKYVVASQFTEIVDQVASDLEALGIRTLKVTGATSLAQRTKAMQKFQSEDTDYRVMLIQTKTGGVAIELDAWCDEMVILDETYIADDQVQLEGRINNRSGRVAPRSWYYFMTEGTVAESIHQANQNQHDLQHQLLDGRRGVETALHLIRGGRS